jgi:hypothetical protein
VLLTLAGGGFFITAFLSVLNQHVLMRFAVPVMLLVTGGLLTLTYFFQRSPAVPPAVE